MGGVMTELMKRYEETTYLDDDPQALIQIIEYLKECIQEYKTKAEELVRVLNAIYVLFDNGERKITAGERANLMIAKALIEKY
jgi:hypothetical protein